jgi:NTP pyrophosphatase (non-canonical NTP hydrolase)
MNWTTYQERALTFVNVAGDLRTYVAFGLLAEVGEVAGVYAKRERGDEADFRSRLLSELGDVAWFCAVGAHVMNVDVQTFRHEFPIFDADRWDLMREIWKSARLFADPVYDSPDDRFIAVNNMVDAWGYMVGNEGFTVAEELAHNLDKLTARQAAGTIRGSGDNR